MSKRKIKSVFAIEAITTESNRYPVREARRDTVGYFSTLAKAEKGLQAFIYSEKIYEKDLLRHQWDLQHIGYIIYERPLNLHAGSDMTFLSARNYSADGELICSSLTPDEAAEYEFFGRKAEESRFHHGDIVESTQFRNAELCIVDLVPITPERIAVRRARVKQMYPDYWETLSRLDYSDDCYLVYSLGEGDTHSHPLSYNVFPPSKPVSEKYKQLLKDKLSEMDELHKDEFSSYSSDGRTLIQAPRYTEKFTIPTTVERIGAFAFSESIYLKEIVIPPTVKEMHMNPFWGCGAKIKSESDEFVIIGEGLYSKSQKRLIHCFTLSDTFRVADGTCEIGGCAFGCYMGDYLNADTARGEIILPASVKKVDEWSFDECCLRRLVINGKIDDLYATGPVDNCAFGEISVPAGLGDYYRKLWYFHSEKNKRTFSLSHASHETCFMAVARKRR